jgi:hypothetical protein
VPRSSASIAAARHRSAALYISSPSSTIDADGPDRRGPARARLLIRLARVRHFAQDVGGGVDLLREALAEAGGDPALRADAAPEFDASSPEPALTRAGQNAIGALGLVELSLDRQEEAHRYLGPLTAAFLSAGIDEPGELRCLPDDVELTPGEQRSPNLSPRAGRTNTASGKWSAVAGGGGNKANNDDSAVGGGAGNTASGYYSAVAGGQANKASGNTSAVAGGYLNTASGALSAVAAGGNNTESGNTSAVAGGLQNTASGRDSAVPGGFKNTAGGIGSFAAGTQAKATRDGSFVWGDGTTLDATSPAANTFSIRASGGIWLGTTSFPAITAGHFIDTSTQAYLTSTGVWTDNSDRALKHDFRPLDKSSVLEKGARMPITTWSYKERAAVDPAHRPGGPGLLQGLRPRPRRQAHHDDRRGRGRAGCDPGPVPAEPGAPTPEQVAQRTADETRARSRAPISSAMRRGRQLCQAGCLGEGPPPAPRRQSRGLDQPAPATPSECRATVKLHPGLLRA